MPIRHWTLDPGERDLLVTIQQRPTADGTEVSGFPSEKSAWTTLEASIYMGRLSWGGSQHFAAGQTTAAFDSYWAMEYREDMDPDLLDVPKLRRLVFNGRVFQIVAAQHINRRNGLELTCLAGTRLDA